MAKLFPTQDPAEIDNDGERKMAEVLVEQLPERVLIFHSRDMLDRKPGGALQEMECDLILLDPQRGMLFVEVKGGPLRCDDGRWTRNGSPVKDPFKQAQGVMRALVKHVKKNIPIYKNGVPFTFGFAVAFPDCRCSGALPPNMKPELLLDEPRLENLTEAMNGCFDAWRRPGHRALGELEVMRISRVLYPGIIVKPIPRIQIEKQEERFVRLTDEQRKILKVLSKHKKAAIQGVAGSGKTLLALDKALETAHAGYRTALLCVNWQLRDWLRLSLPPGVHGENLVINTHWALTVELCKKAGVEVPDIDDDGRSIPNDLPAYKGHQKFWLSDKAPKALQAACEKLGAEHKFEAVIVDEGQEFDELWWVSIDSLFRDPADKACFYVFYDPDQSLYIKCLRYFDSFVSGKAPALLPSPPEELGPPLTLHENCRNTRRIAKHCAKLAGCESQQRDGTPEGVEPEEIQVESPLDAFQEAARIVRMLCAPAPAGGGLEKSQIALLSPEGPIAPPSLCLAYSWAEDPKNPPLTGTVKEWAENEGVLHASLFSFKGVEADAVIVIEVPPPLLIIFGGGFPVGWVGPFSIVMPPLTTGYYGELDAIQRYVAHSRAKHRLTIIKALNPAPLMSEETLRKFEQSGTIEESDSWITVNHELDPAVLKDRVRRLVESGYFDLLEAGINWVKSAASEEQYRQFEEAFIPQRPSQEEREAAIYLLKSESNDERKLRLISLLSWLWGIPMGGENPHG